MSDSLSRLTMGQLPLVLAPSTADQECLNQFSPGLCQVLLHYITGHDVAAASSILLNDLLQLTGSSHGFMGEVLQDGGSSRCCLRTHAVAGFAWPDNLAEIVAVEAAAPYQGLQLEALLWQVIHHQKAISVSSAVVASAAVTCPEINSLLCLPICDGDQLLGLVGLANRRGGYDAADQGRLCAYTAAYAAILGSARAGRFQLSVLEEMKKLCSLSKPAERELVRGLNETVQAMRTPLNAVLGHAQVLLLTAQDARGKQEQEAIYSGGLQLSQMLESLQRQLSADGEAPPHPVTTPLPAYQASACKVLVVEDNPANQAILHLQLDSLGLSADMAGDGPTALAKWKTVTYDLILSDVHLPGMDGLTLARTIRAAEQSSGTHVPIIAVTAVQQALVWSECRAAGIDDVLPKPIELDEMRRVLKRWLPDCTLLAPQPVHVPEVNAVAILDTSHIARITGSASFMQMHDLVRLFTSTAQAELVLCGRAISARDCQAVAMSMHKLKSSACSVGALRFSALAQQLEQIARLGPADAMQALFYDLQHAIDEVERALQQLAPSEEEEVRSCETPPSRRDQFKRVLVVDDDPIACKQAGIILSSLNVTEVVTVNCSEDALVAIRNEDAPIDFVLTDLKMPGMDGIEFLRLLADSGYQGKLAICSGVDDQLLHTAADFARAKGLHLCGTIHKPVSLQGLTQLLDDVVQQDRPIPPQRAPSVSANEVLEGMRLDEFLVHYQPIVAADTLDVIGVEALARWHGENGFIPIETVIMVAERNGLIGQLSEMLLTKALIGGAGMMRSGFHLQLAINISVNWLTDVNLPEFIMASCQATGFPVERLVLELTETGVMADLATSLDVLTRLRLKGFTLAIDDFGTGYASLERLQRIPFSELKIDRSFVRQAVDNPQSQVILASCVEMARKLKLFTVAEGVETEEDLQLVRALGCDAVQGWLVAKPMPLNRLIQWLQTRQEK